jgi:hypothetical protein
MCWSAGASAGFAVAGASITAYAIYKKEPTAIWMVLGYFTVMEVLQALSYNSIDQCASEENLLMSKLSFAHILFQPFFFNAIALCFVSHEIKERAQLWAYGACAVASLLMLLQLHPISGGGQCANHRAMCGPDFCTYLGNWHLAWQFPFNDWGNGFADSSNPILQLFPGGHLPYTIAVFIVPLIYGAWKMAGFMFLVGPVLVRLLTDNIDEQPAIWCTMSLAIICVIAFSPLSRWLRQEGWWFS